MDINEFTIERSTGDVTAAVSPLIVYNDVIPFSIALTDSAVANTTALGLASLGVSLRLGTDTGVVLASCLRFTIVDGVATGFFHLEPAAQDLIFRSADGAVFVEFIVSEKTGPSLRYLLEDAIDVEAAGGGGGTPTTDASDLTSGILAPARLLTFNTLYPVWTAMAALEIDVTKANEKAFTGNETLTYSATPATGVQIPYKFSADGTARVLTLPAGTHRSVELNATITTITIPANSTVYGTIAKTAAGYDISHQLSAAQQASAAGLGPTDVVEFGGMKLKVVNKSASYTLGTDDPAEAYGAWVNMTGAGVVTLPAVATGMCCVVHTVGDIAVSIDPNAADKIWLEGVALDDGDKITNLSTSGDLAVVVAYTGDGWQGATNGWTDGGA